MANKSRGLKIMDITSRLFRDKNFTVANDDLFDCELKVTVLRLIKMMRGQKSQRPGELNWT